MLPSARDRQSKLDLLKPKVPDWVMEVLDYWRDLLQNLFELRNNLFRINSTYDRVENICDCAMGFATSAILDGV